MALTKNQKKEFAYMQANFEVQASGDSGFYQISCPGCGEPIGRSGTYVPHISRYYCFQTGCRYSKQQVHKGTWIVEFVRQINRLQTNSQAWELIQKARTTDIMYQASKPQTGPRKEIILPPYSLPINQGEGAFSKRARSYLRFERGYDVDSIWENFNLYHITRTHPKQNLLGYLVIPFFDANGVLEYYQLRAYLPNMMRWINPKKGTFNVGKGDVIFHRRALATVMDTLHLTEGATDTMTMLGGGILGLFMSKRVLLALTHSSADSLSFIMDGGSWIDTLNHAHRALATGKPCYATPMEGTDDPNSLGREGTLRRFDKYGIEITTDRYLEELSRVEYKTTKTGGQKSFRGKHKRLIW